MVFEKLAPKQRHQFRRAIVNRGDWLGSRKVSKEQTKMPRLMLKGPRQCKIVCSELRHYARLTLRNVSIG